MGVKVTAGTRRRRGASERRRATIQSLTASGVATELQTTFDMTRGTPAERFFSEAVLAAGLTEFGSDRWPCEMTELGQDDLVAFRDGCDIVKAYPDGTYALVCLSYGWMTVRVAAPTRDPIPEVCSAFRVAYPASYLTQDADSRVPITFWSLSRFGPDPRLRKIEASSWEDIEGNYTAGVKDELARLMAWDSGSESDGQLLLWRGDPGTGKSWALRALASSWARWAEFHYITDPDSFFVTDPSYMISVLLADSYDAIDQPTGDVYTETDPGGKWRVLILEDTGELLAADAKETYAQGLSRLLNVVDGMIGQGLRVLALVTTNDELGDLHPAVVRPGRCASQIEFGPLTDAEAAVWTGDRNAQGGTIAELYSRYGKAPMEAIEAENLDVDAMIASGCQCAACSEWGPQHASDCAVHNMPAFANGPCDCGVLLEAMPEDAAMVEAMTLAAQPIPFKVDPPPWLNNDAITPNALSAVADAHRVTMNTITKLSQ